ncbi:MAG: hypothetical protein ACE5FM_08785, partial [Methyloligellaceae bacterium]
AVEWSYDAYANNDELFYAEATRKVKKDNTFSFSSRRYETPVDLRDKEIQLRYDRRRHGTGGDPARKAAARERDKRFGEGQPNLRDKGQDRGGRGPDRKRRLAKRQHHQGSKAH